MLRTAASTLTLVALMALCAPAAAHGGTRELYEEYRQSGTIDGCAHAAAELSEALEGVPADIKAYDPGFADALNVALERRAAGCMGPASADPLLPVAVSGERRAADGSPGPRDPRVAPVAGLGGVDGGDFPVGLLALGIVAAAGLAAAALSWRRVPTRRRR